MLADLKILAFQNPKFKILTNFKILAWIELNWIELNWRFLPISRC